jgi:hypothetical protein
MDERTRRIGLNEAVFRTVNEQVEALNRRFAAATDGMVRIICECGDVTCFEQLALPAADYERIRSDATLFFTLPGHERPEVEAVVEESDGYLVVRKHEGEAARIARQTDPRGA